MLISPSSQADIQHKTERRRSCYCAWCSPVYLDWYWLCVLADTKYGRCKLNISLWQRPSQRAPRRFPASTSTERLLLPSHGQVDGGPRLPYWHLPARKCHLGHSFERWAIEQHLALKGKKLSSDRNLPHAAGLIEQLEAQVCHLWLVRPSMHQ